MTSQTRLLQQSCVAECVQNMEEALVTGSPPNPDSRPPLPSPPTRDSAEAADQSWKDVIAARVRARRGPRTANQPTLPGMEEAFTPASIAARVAERYSRLPSWRESLAAQTPAQSTIDSAVASGSAAPPAEPGAPNTHGVGAMGHEPEQRLAIQETVVEPNPDADPQPYQPDLLRYSVSSDSLPATRSTPPEAHALATAASNSSDNPFDPLETAVVEPTRPLPARLITTPRELVAPRKARPRLAEGPLRDEPGFDALSEAPAIVPEQRPIDNSARGSIGFPASRVEPESAAPAPPGRGPEWHSIHLDTESPIRERRSLSSSSSSSMPDQPVLDVASFEDRTMAALVDCALTLCAFLLFSTVFAISSTNLPHGRIALIGAAAILLATWLLYQLLFFTLTDATPGMRYARIALCTFNDENPSRAALRGRIAAMLLSALPLGLGFLWAVFDEDSLGWHDRITRTYQRSYREG